MVELSYSELKEGRKKYLSIRHKGRFLSIDIWGVGATVPRWNI